MPSDSAVSLVRSSPPSSLLCCTTVGTMLSILWKPSYGATGWFSSFNTRGELECNACKPGYYTDVPQAATCQPCEPGALQDCCMNRLALSLRNMGVSRLLRKRSRAYQMYQLRCAGQLFSGVRFSSIFRRYYGTLIRAPCCARNGLARSPANLVLEIPKDTSEYSAAQTVLRVNARKVRYSRAARP